MYNIFKYLFIGYTCICVIVSIVAFYFLDETPSTKGKKFIIGMDVVWLLILMVLMEIK